MHQHTPWQTRGHGKTFRAKFVWDDVPDRGMWSKCFLKLPGESGKSVVRVTVLHLPATSGRCVDTELLSGWLSWRRWWLQGCLCECQSSVAAPTAVSQSQNYRAECSGQFTELQMGGSKGQMYSLLWFSRKQTARAWPAPHRGLFGQSEFMLGNRNKWVISNTGFSTLFMDLL